MASIEAEWIEWNGGELPVDANAEVEAKCNDGIILCRDARFVDWTHVGDKGDIVAYRIHNAFEGAPDEATHLLGHANMRAFVTLRDGKYYDPVEIIESSYRIANSAWQVIATRKREESTADKCKPKFDNIHNFTGNEQLTISDLVATSTNDDAYLIVGEPEYTGGSVNYYTVRVDHPTNPYREPYEAECNDIIEALQMDYASGNAFKAIWRRSAAKLGKRKKGYTDGLYDAEKVVFFGQRMVEQERNKKS